MSNPNKARGTKWERDTCDYLNGYLGYEHPASWQYVKRVVQNGARDLGDIHAWPFILEAKDVKSPAVPTWLRQADTEAINAGYLYSVVCHKVRGKGPALARVHLTDATYRAVMKFSYLVFHYADLSARGYWTLTLAEFAEVLKEIRAATPPPA